MVQYDIPVMKVQTYTIDNIFEKRLLLLIPFYIFSHENHFSEYERNDGKLAELKTEYQRILEKLDGLEQQGEIGAFDKRTIIELSSDVIKQIAQNYENVPKGVGDMMTGALIQTTARTILDPGKKEGRILLMEAYKLLKKGLSDEEIPGKNIDTDTLAATKELLFL